MSEKLLAAARTVFGDPPTVQLERLLRPDAMRTARALRDQGLTPREIARILSLTVPAVRELLEGRQ